MAHAADALPPEILVEIFGYLEPPDHAAVMGVCRVWRAVASDEWLWRRTYLSKVVSLFGGEGGAYLCGSQL